MVATRAIGNNRAVDHPGRRNRVGETDPGAGDDGFKIALGAASGSARAAGAARPTGQNQATPGRQQPAAARGAVDAAPPGPLPARIGLKPGAPAAPIETDPAADAAGAPTAAEVPDKDAATIPTAPAGPSPNESAAPLPVRPRIVVDPAGITAVQQLGGIAAAAGPSGAKPAPPGGKAPDTAPRKEGHRVAGAGQETMLAAQNVAAAAVASVNLAAGAPAAALARAGVTAPSDDVGTGGSAVPGIDDAGSQAVPRAGMAAANLGSGGVRSPAANPVAHPVAAPPALPANVAAAVGATNSDAAYSRGDPKSAPSSPAGKTDVAAATPALNVSPPAGGAVPVAAVATPAAASTAADRPARPQHGIAAVPPLGAEVAHAMGAAGGSNAATGAGATMQSTATPASGNGLHNVTDQLSRPMLGLLAGGGHEVVLRLNPPELGDVSVRVLISGRDVLAWFDASQQPVQQAISQGMSQLHADLAGAGYNLNSAWVGGDAWTPRGRAANPGLPRPARAGAGLAPVQDITGVAAPAAGSGVSIYV